MKKLLLFCLFLFLFSQFFAQSSQNISVLARVEYEEELSDVWGYTDEQGREYALVGLFGGTSIVDLSNPSEPVEISFISGGRSIWKDIKVYKNRAFIIGEYGQGMQIIDLSNLPNPIDDTQSVYWAELNTQGAVEACHNIYIEEKTGIAYLSGCGDGIVMVDIKPEIPVKIGTINSLYSHDVYVRNDTVYSSNIDDGFFSIIDVTNKQQPKLLANQNTPFNFTHNTWLSDNGKVIYTTDELNNAPVASYDISDLSNIKLLDKFYPNGTKNTGLIPHNVHVKNDFLITSYYTEGVVITDATRPANLIQVGNFDTYNGENGGFFGAWGVFPFFDSDIILVSDIENGLYILKPKYVRASLFEGTVIDAVSENGIPSVKITGTYRGQPIIEEQTNIAGRFNVGAIQSGEFQIEFSKSGFKSQIINVNLQNGALVEKIIMLLPDGLSIKGSKTTGCVPHEITFSTPGVPMDNFQWTFEGGIPATSTERNPIVKYEQKGNYKVQLIAMSATDTFDLQKSNLVKVIGVPSPDFTFERNRNTFIFTNLSEEADSYFWDFGDGNTSLEENPIHIFSEQTPKIITLASTNECGTKSIARSPNGAITTSLESLNILASFQASPNPFFQQTNIHYSFKNPVNTAQLILMDVAGRLLATYSIRQQSGSIELENSLQKGLYFVQIIMGNEKSKVLKIVALD